MISNHATLLILLGATVVMGPLAEAAAAGNGLCRNLEHRLDRCEAGARLGAETRASCDRIEEGFRALCGPLDTIRVEGSADGLVLDLLEHDYEIVDLEEEAPGVDHTPIVIGPAGLDRPRVMALVARAYRAGLTVAIAGAVQEEADRFDALVEGASLASGEPAEGASEIALYALQQTLRENPPVALRYCLPELVGIDATRSHNVRRWLRERFAATRPQPPQPLIGAGPVNLDELSKQFHCSGFAWELGGQIQQDVFITSLRSFDQDADFYYVQNFVQYFPTATELFFSQDARGRAVGGQLATGRHKDFLHYAEHGHRSDQLIHQQRKHHGRRHGRV